MIDIEFMLIDRDHPSFDMSGSIYILESNVIFISLETWSNPCVVYFKIIKKNKISNNISQNHELEYELREIKNKYANIDKFHWMLLVFCGVEKKNMPKQKVALDSSDLYCRSTMVLTLLVM